MVEREDIKVSRNAPWNKTPSLLEEGAIDVVIKTARKGKCIVEFTEELPEELREILEGLDLNAHSISGREPKLYQLYAKDITENDVMCIIDGWVKIEGIGLKEVSFSQDG